MKKDKYITPLEVSSALSDCNRRFAFTLSEVLITLGIIGIVAAMTLPVLTAKYMQKQTVTQLKKSYTEISQLLKLSEIDNGPIEYWDYTLSGQNFYFKYIKPYLKNVKEIPNSEFKKYMVYLNLNGSQCTGEVWCTQSDSYYSFLSNGTVIGLMTHPSQTKYKAVSVDINGDKKPNQLGKDVFIFCISKTKKALVPYGFSDAGISGGVFTDYDRNKIKTGGDYSCNKSNKGIWCAGLIVTDGWEIKDDYPW